ncbi:hypothetical protein V8B97DRAFT_2026325 [Scleroderma yunnanense]
MSHYSKHKKQKLQHINFACLLSPDNRRTSVRGGQLIVPLSMDRSCLEDRGNFNESLQEDIPLVDAKTELTVLSTDVDAQVQKRKQTLRDFLLMAWVLECATFLNELLQSKGWGDYASWVTCAYCQCMELFCGGCIVKTHLQLLFHHVEQWVDTHFTRVTLKSLILCLQLGHAVSDQCCNLKCAFRDKFVVIDINGIHDVALDFCDCGMAQSHVIQLLHAHLFSAIIIDPKTAIAF